jgi:hypothetical protein
MARWRRTAVDGALGDPPAGQVRMRPSRQVPQRSVRWRGRRQRRRLASYQARRCLGGPHAVPRRPAARPAPDPLSRQAPQPPHGGLLHGAGLAASRRALERPPRLHPPAAGHGRPPRQRPHLRRRPPTAGRPDPLGDRPDRRRPAHRRPDRVAVGDHGLAGGGDRAAARSGGLGASLRARPGRTGRASARSPRGAEPPTLAEVPQAAAWAYRFTSGVRPSHKGFRRQAAPTIVQDAVEGIAQASVPDPDGMLRDLLVQAIDVCAAWVGRHPDRGTVVEHTLWVSACQRTDNQYR